MKNGFPRLSTCSSLALITTILLSTNTLARTQTVKISQTQQSNANVSGFIYPTQGIVSQGFRKYKHEGIDIANASGTPILAAAAGKVIKTGWDDWGLGNVVKIQHADGRVTVYGHNRRILVSNGQQVTQSQIIAEMGSTGNSSAPHLHFEIHTNRLAVNPLNILPSLNSNQVAARTISTTIQNRPSVNQVKILPSPAANTQCQGVTLINGETANAHVKVCQENGQLFYIGELKQNPNQPVRLPARNVSNSKYRADNGSFSYLVSPQGVEVLRNGQPFRSDNFYTYKQS
jgi:lipoprotein NlpD